MRNVIPLIVLAVVAVGVADAGTPEPPVELGAVEWGRSFDEALDASATSGKPVFVLFQEVPGCATCQNFGKGPLSHPLLVEAMETEFEPVVVFNNKPGIDAEVLQACNEPAWNNPVVRFMDSSGHDILPRRDRIYGTGGIADRMIEALQKSGRRVPEYLSIAALENTPRVERTTLGMHCFWEGEAGLGELEGVVATRPGWVDGHEVVEVTFDPSKTSSDALAGEAARRGISSKSYDGDSPRDAKPSDRWRHLRFSPLRYLPLTPLQATRVNSALAGGENPARYLSPRQQQLAVLIERKLAEDETGLSALERPADIGALAAYTKQLEKRLKL